MDKDNLAIIIGSVITGLTLVNEKARNFILGKVAFKKATTDATDDTIEKLMSRVNALSDEFSRLSELNIKTQKENYEHRAKIIGLENEIININKKIVEKCKSKCFE